MRTIRAIENSDICLLMLDATDGFDAQDLNILHLVERNRKAVVLVVNKWDLVEKDQNTMKEYESVIKRRIAPFTDIPIVFTSVTEKQRIYKTIELAAKVRENRSRRISTSKLNDVLLPLIKATPPPIVKRKVVRIKYITQLKTPFPAFAFFCNLPQYVKDPYKRFIENKIREKFDFSGVPMEIYFRKK
jgi:GTPase